MSVEEDKLVLFNSIPIVGVSMYVVGVLCLVFGLSQAFLVPRAPLLSKRWQLGCAGGDDTPIGEVEAVEAAPVTDLSKMEIRVGQIVEIGTHPDADTLFVEKVDVGEEDGPRTIVSGLVNFCSAEELTNRKVVVLCNLKPRAMRGITSAGMLLCGSNDDHSKVEPLIVPDGTPNGELITFEGHASAPIEPGNKSSKIYSKICDNFKVNENGEATYDGVLFQTTAGPIKSSFIKGSIS